MRRIAVVVATIACALLPIQASAAPPTVSHFTIIAGPLDISYVCAHDFTVSSVIPVTETDYTDSSGRLTRILLHPIETDTFSGPGGTLTSYPYQYEGDLTFDRSGNIVKWFSDGETLRVPLPDGSLFVSAGRVDVLGQNVPFNFVPDFGHAHNLAGFCAALGA